MNTESLIHFWPLIHSLIQAFWEITEPPIEEAAIRNNIPIDLYIYGEFGSDTFSTHEFQKRDPFSNPVLFEKVFATLNFKGWIEPLPDDRYGVTEQARQAVRKIAQAGETHLLRFESYTDVDMSRLALLLNQIVQANESAPEPPEKWAIVHRDRTTGKDSPLILQIREHLMDIFAYRDDSHIAAAHPHFGRAGIVWNVLGVLCSREEVTAEELAKILSFRGYESGEYDVALHAAAQIGWAEEAGAAGTFTITPKGQELHTDVERLTNEYFYAPWSILVQDELDELRDLLLKFREQLVSFRRVK